MQDLERPRLKRVLQDLSRGALALQLRHTAGPAWRELAALRACAGLLTDGRIRRSAGAALEALNAEPSPRARLRFASSWWFEGATHWLHAYQADRLTPQWCEAHVAGLPRLPPGGAVMVSVHHFNQRLAWVRLAGAVEHLGIVSAFELADAFEPDRDTLVDAQGPRSQLSALYRRTFGDRIYRSPNAALKGLRLLEQGGYLILGPDVHVGPERDGVLGRLLGVAPGALWLARRSGRPIVPFVLASDRQGWRLWCGEPVAAGVASLARALEDCIRHAPTRWMLWPLWFDLPAADGA